MNKHAEAIAAELEVLAGLMDEIDDLQDVAAEALPNKAELRERMEDALKRKVSRPVESLLDVLARHGQLDLLQAVSSEFRDLLTGRQGKVKATVTTAFAMDSSEQQAVTGLLGQALDAELVVKARVDEALLGGMVVRVGDRVYDASVATQLRRLRRHLTDRISDRCAPGTSPAAQEARADDSPVSFEADEVARVVREELAAYHREFEVSQVGCVLEVGDGIAQVAGLSEAKAGEMLEFETGQMGQVFNLNENSIGTVVYGLCEQIKEGDVVRGTGRLLEVPVGSALLGRIVDPLGRALDGRGAIHTGQMRPVEFPAPPIADRQPVYEPLSTGITAVDSMTPIGRGQRQLIIGDRKTGKTTIAIDTIINQKDTGVVCVYVAIGQKESTVADVVGTLRRHGAMDRTIVVSASSSDPAPLQYIAPYSGCAMAEHFMYDQGRATLVVYDDLSKQAAAYRQISLLLRRPPGREAYPGDVFYLHSRLLERAGKLAERYVVVAKNAPDREAEGAARDGRTVYVGPIGLKAARGEIRDQGNPDDFTVHRLRTSGGSMTALPICETQEGDIAGYIPTNLISITDGQLYLEPKLFFAGVRPAINVRFSVSRVGFKAARAAMKEVAKSLRLDLAVYRELQQFSQLGMELEPAAQRQLDRGARIVNLLTQPRHQVRPVIEQIIAIYTAVRGFLDELPVEEVQHFVAGLMEHVKGSHRDFYDDLDAAERLDEEQSSRLRFLIDEFKDSVYKTTGSETNSAALAESSGQATQ